MDWNQEDRTDLGKVPENAKSWEWVPIEEAIKSMDVVLQDLQEYATCGNLGQKEDHARYEEAQLLLAEVEMQNNPEYYAHEEVMEELYTMIEEAEKSKA